MAIGDDAIAAGYPTVPDTGEEGRVRWGARELNRTRDFVAQVLAADPGRQGGLPHGCGYLIRHGSTNRW
jgi:hypothetical protein